MVVVLIYSLVVPKAVIFGLPSRPHIALQVTRGPRQRVLFYKPIPNVMGFCYFKASPSAFHLYRQGSGLFGQVSTPIRLFLPPVVQGVRGISVSLGSETNGKKRMHRCLFLLSLVHCVISGSYRQRSIVGLCINLCASSNGEVFLPSLGRSPKFVLYVLRVFVFRVASKEDRRVFVSVPLV